MGITRDFANIIRSNGDIVISGDLDVNGTQTTINTTTFVVEDKNIELGANATSNSQNDGAGISILLPDASPDEFATLTYVNSSDAWSFNKNVGIGTSSPNTTLTLSDGTDEFDFGVTANQLMIKSVTSDGSDDQRIIIDAGNGGLSSTRGAFIALSGNEASIEAGKSIYQMGNVAGSSHVFRKAGGIDAVTIDSDGNLAVGATSDPGGFATPSRFSFVGSAQTAAIGTYPIVGAVYDDRAYNSTSPEPGGGIGFGYKYNTGGTYAVGPSIQGFKENTTDGNFAGGLRFFTRANGLNPAERMRIDSSGNVGIGTSSPRRKLEVYGAAGANVLQSQDSADSTNFLRMYSDVSEGGAINVNTGGIIRFAHSDESFANFVERMTIDASGNVGIGTDPQSFSKFQVKAATDQHVSVFTNASGLTIGGLTDNGGSGALRIAGAPLHLTGQGGGAGSGPDIAIISDGKVGIGTDSPSTPLTLKHSATTDETGGFRIIDSNNSVRANFYYNGVQAFVIHGASDPSGTDPATLQFATGGVTPTPRMSILKNGNVGIGTTTPDYLLDVSKSTVGGVTDMRVFNEDTTNAASGARGIITVANASVGDPRLVLGIIGIKEYSLGIDNSDGDKFKINDGSDPSAGTNYLTIDSGNVGIGTSDIQHDAKLDISILDETYTNAHTALRLGSRTSLGVNEAALTFAVTGQALQGTIFSNYGYDNDVAYQEEGGRPSGYISFSNGLPNTGTGRIIFGGSQIGSTTLIEHAQFNPSGNLQFANGKGIDFSALTSPATSGTATGNVLNDYEEGTWTASVSAGAISGTNLRFQGSYTKVGRQVFISLFIDSTTGASDIQISSYVQFSGVPFNIAKKGTGTVTTEDIDVYARQGFAELGSTFLTISAAGSSSGTSSLSIGIVGTTA